TTGTPTSITNQRLVYIYIPPYFYKKSRETKYLASLLLNYVSSISSTICSTTCALSFFNKSPPPEVNTFSAIIVSIASLTATGSIGSTGLSNWNLTNLSS